MPFDIPDIIQPAASDTISSARCALDETFASIDAWCVLPENRLQQRPAYPHAWTAAEHLEHVALVNHFLLLTIGKGVAAALRRARTQLIPAGESDLARLAPIADPDAFPWEPPGHMIPSGTKAISEVREQLSAQHRRCLEFLEGMGKGEGRLCCFSMSVNRLGKLDMYQWLYFLAQHCRWHLEFLARRENETLCCRLRCDP